MFSNGISGDLVDEPIRMDESICLEAMYKLCRGAVAVFGDHNLRGPNRCQGHSLAHGGWHFYGVS
jgi:hypothetical protein